MWSRTDPAQHTTNIAYEENLYSTISSVRYVSWQVKLASHLLGSDEVVLNSPSVDAGYAFSKQPQLYYYSIRHLERKEYKKYTKDNNQIHLQICT